MLRLAKGAGLPIVEGKLKQHETLCDSDAGVLILERFYLYGDSAKGFARQFNP